MADQRIEIAAIASVALLVGFAVGCAATSPPVDAAVATTPIGAAVLSRSVRLASRESFEPSAFDPVYLAGTRVDLLQAFNAYEGTARLYRVRTPDGRVGFTTILPQEIAS